jgi:hypothetical protein
MPDLLICTVEKLKFLAIEAAAGKFPAFTFVEGLDEIGQRDFRVAARIISTTVVSGRPPAGRSERVAGSKLGLFELRITPPGRRGPHARLLYMRDAHSIRCAHGVLKRERLARRDIELAERIVRASE